MSVALRRSCRRASTGSIAVRFLAVVALALGMTSVLTVTVAPPAAADAALLCDQNTVYGIDVNGDLRSIDVNSGTTATIADMSPSNNGLAMSSAGLDAWAFDNVDSNIVHYNTVTGAVTTVASNDPGATSIIRGAINPANGLYYYASGGTSAFVGAYNTVTGGTIGKVGTITGLTDGNGDFAFSTQGLMFVVSSDQVRRVDDSTPPTTGGNQILTTSLVATLPTGTNSAGITFASDGFLFVTSGANLIKLDPASGAQVGSPVAMSGGYNPIDLASCTYPNTISVAKNVVSRASTSDQFSLSVTGGGIVSGNTATTSGSATGVQAAVAGAALTIPSRVYTFAETGAATTVLANYTATYRCVDINSGATVASGIGTTGTLTFPAATSNAGTDVICTFTNTAKPTLTVTAALSAARANAGDQFTAQIRTGSATGTVVNATANSTTTGTNATVTPGTGTTGTFAGVAGTTYFITEAASGSTNLAQYGKLISCTDPTGRQSGLPTAQPFSGSLALTVADGAQISCTVSNAPLAPTVVVSAALGSPRVAAGDQFTVGVRTGSASGTVVSATTNSTTTGTDSTVTAGSGTTGSYTAAAGTTYYLTQATAGTGAARYTSTITCTDANGIQTGLPTGAPYAGSQTVVPVAGAAISCAVTNTGTAVALALAKTNPAQLIVDAAADYTLVVTNNGGTTTTTARVTDQLPVNLQYNSATGTGWSCAATGTAATGQLVTCDYAGSIAPFGTSTLTVNVTPLTAAAGLSKQNKASVDPTGGSSPVAPSSCTATGTPAGCAVPPAQNPALVTAANDTGSTPPAIPLATAVLANDTVSSGSTLNPASVTVLTAPAHGGTALNPATGAVTYTPTAGFSGVDGYTYRVCDTSTPIAACATATVTITVPSVVTATDDVVTTPQNTTVGTTVTANDTITINGAPLDLSSVTVTVAPAQGTTSVNATTGVVSYMPNAGYSGPDSYTYRVCDTSTPTPQCATAAVEISVGVNTVDANPDTDSTPPATPVRTDVAFNDSSATGQPLLNPVVITSPTHGTAAVDDATGEIGYLPATGFSGVDSYGYRICDTSVPTAVCDSTTVTITVPSVLTVVVDTDVTAPAIPVTTAVLRNDTITESGAPLDPATVEVTVEPAHGSAVVDAQAGTVTYAPEAGFSGIDSYSYRVCDTSAPTPQCGSAVVTIEVPNVLAVVDDVVATAQNTPVTTPVLANDLVAPGGAPLVPGSVTVSTPAAHGSTSVNPTTGAVTYTPATSYSGPDSYTYQVCDSSVPESVCVTATVTVTVGTNVVAADPDAAITPPAAPVFIDVAINDSSATPEALNLIPTIITPPSHGTVEVSDLTGVVTYTPALRFTGVDTFTYRICDVSTPTPVCATAPVLVTVPSPIAAVDDAATTPQNTVVAVDVLANDTITTGGSDLDPASVAVSTAAANGSTAVNPETGVISYTPAANFSGTDAFGYVMCDASIPTVLCDSATVTVVVTANVVIADDDTSYTLPGTAMPIDVLGNDTVTDNGAPLDPASVTVTTAPTGGTTTVDPATGVITYTPAADFAGTDTFSYRVCDESTPTPVCDPATVTVTVPKTGLSFVKHAVVDDTNGDGVTSIGDTIGYTFTVTNIGDISVNGIGVVDAKAGETTCPVSELAAGQSTECVAVDGHVITAEDAVTGVSNSALVVGVTNCPEGAGQCLPDVEVKSEVNTVVTPVSSDARLTVTKTGAWTDGDGDGAVSVGDTVTWEITVINPGTAAVDDLVVSDPSAGEVTCPVTHLEAGESTACVVPAHQITAADIAEGSVSNTAGASGVGPVEAVVSPAVTTTVTLPAGQLSYTGFNPWGFVGYAVLALIVGSALTLLGSRRRRPEAES